jgi:hypothetical protein
VTALILAHAAATAGTTSGRLRYFGPTTAPDSHSPLRCGAPVGERLPGPNRLGSVCARFRNVGGSDDLRVVEVSA